MTSPTATPDRSELHREIAALIERHTQGTPYVVSESTDPLTQILYSVGEYFDSLHHLYPGTIATLHRIFGEYATNHPKETKEVFSLLSAVVSNAFALAQDTTLSQITAEIAGGIPAIVKRHGLWV